MSDASQAAKRTGPPIIFLGVLAAISPISLGIAVQSIPAIAVDYDASYASAQLIVSVFLLSFAASQLVVGPMSDKFGRKPVLYAGLGLYGAASIAAAFAPSIEILVIARFAQGAGGCAALITSRAVVQDSYRGLEAAQMMAFVAMLQSVAPAIGPVIGGGIDALLGWRSIFGFLAILAGLLALGSVLWLRETRPVSADGVASWATILLRYARLLRSRLYLGYTLTFTCGTTGFFGFVAVGPALLIGERGLSPFGFSLALMLISTQFVAGSYTASRLVRRIGLDRTLVAGTAGVTAGAVLLLALADRTGIAAVVVPIAVYAFFNGFIFPNAMAGATGVDPLIAGSAASFLGFAQLGTGAVIAFVLAILPTSDVVPLSICLIGLGVLTAAGMALVFTAQRR